MDTHLTPLNEAVVREREAAMRTASERSETIFRAHVDTSSEVRRPPTAKPSRRRGGGLEVFVMTMFAMLAAGLVSLVFTSLQT